MWFNLLGMAVKTGAEVYKNRQETKKLESLAEKNHMAKMASGEINYQKAVMTNQNQGWKDELVLIIVVLPIVVLSKNDLNTNKKESLLISFPPKLV